MKHLTLYKESDRYCSFPHVAKLSNGNLAVVFRKASQFSADAAKKGLATHHDPDSSIEWIESSDGGFHWSEQSRTVYNSDFGVNDPALTVLADGTILLRFVALKIVPTAQAGLIEQPIFSHRVEHGLVTTVVGNLVLESRDSGVSWETIGNSDTPQLKYSCSRDPIIEMPDHSLLMSVYTGAPQRSDIAWVIRSFDRGRTWQQPISIMCDPNGQRSQLHGINYNETSLLHLGRGEVLALTRGDKVFHTDGNEFMPVGGVGELYLARSLDGGLCWTPPMRTGIWGQPGALLRLSNGDLLATYGYRRKPFGVRCCLSRDNGKTWSTESETIVREDAPTWDVGYPFSIQMDDGHIFTVYYFVDEEGTRHIAGTHWELS